MSDLDQALLRESIRSSFPVIPYKGLITDCPCEECVDIKNRLAGRAWTEIPEETIDFMCCPTLLNPEAFRAFLPAFLLRGLDDPTAKQRAVADLTLYALIPSRDLGSSFAQERARLMDDSQLAAVNGYIAFLRDSGEYSTFKAEISEALNSIWVPSLPQERDQERRDP